MVRLTMSIRMRHTSGHTRNRRAHHKLAKPAAVTLKSGAITLKHHADMTTGTYRGKKLFDPMARVEKKMKKIVAKRAAAEKAGTHDHAHEGHAHAAVEAKKADKPTKRGLLGAPRERTQQKKAAGSGKKAG